MKILGIIPVRYASSRFPGKPLALIHGKPMIRRVYEQVQQSASISRLIVATDDERIVSEVTAFKGEVILTSVHHQSGTERCAEVRKQLKETFDVVINIQGDEPFIQPQQIELLCSLFQQDDTQISTLIKKITEAGELTNPNVVKVVVAENNEALYFSRSPIPFFKGVSGNYWLSMGTYYKHVGIYGYKSEVLEQIVKLPVNQLEHAESLEQLRWLANGYSIKTAITDLESFSIDTPTDLEHAIKFLA